MTLHTTNSGTGIKGSSNLRIQQNIQILLNGKLLVSLQASIPNPSFKLRSKSSKDHITDVRSRHFPDLSKNWKAVNDALVGESEFQDEIKFQAFVLGNIDHLDLRTKNRTYKN
jgi:hypothetical protein